MAWLAGLGSADPDQQGPPTVDIDAVLATTSLVETLRWVVRVAFVGLAVLALYQWSRLRSRAAGWLSITFGVLAAALIISVLDIDPDASTASFITHKFQVSLLVLFPYALYRFMRTFLRARRDVGVLVNVLTASALLAIIVTPLPVSLEDPTAWYQSAIVYLVIVQFGAVSLLAAGRLWWAGYRLPPVARGRMRTLAVGAVTLASALFLAPLDAPGIAALVQAMALISAILFYIGFVPPAPLRTVWRGSVGALIQSAEREIATAMTRDDVAAAIAPVVRSAFAARGVALETTGGETLAQSGDTAPTDDGPAEQPEELREEVSGGQLVVVPSIFAPHYGEDEADLLDTFGTLTSLALERADLFAQERAARAQIAAAHEELEALVYGISHDLKNPIISLLGYAELLNEEHGERLDDEGRHFLHRMSASAAYMQELLNDLLELSRVGRIETEAEPVDLAPLARTVRDEVVRSHEGVTVEVSDGLPVVEMNAVRARQLLTNLVENAVRHGGRDDIRVRISAEPGPPGYAAVIVSDDGVGIPEEHRERVFGIFERLGASGTTGTGTGIGLAICRRIVESFGGSIRAREAEQGATIEVMLPRVGEPVRTQRPGAEGAAEPAIRGASHVTRSRT